MKKLYYLPITIKQQCLKFSWLQAAWVFVFFISFQSYGQQIEVPSSCQIIDFEQEAPGLITTTSTSKGTVSIHARKRNVDGTYAPENHASIFNTQSPTGDDSDLYTSDWGNVLIINQDLGDEPNDNPWGGEVTIDFSAFGPVTVYSLKALDFDVYESNALVYLYDGDGKELWKATIESMGNNSKQEIFLNNTRNVMKLKVVLDGRNPAGMLAGSGAIDNIKFCVEDDNYIDANAGPDVFLYCTESEAKLYGASHKAGAAFRWSGPDGFTSTIAQPTVTLTGTYTLTVTDPVTGATASDQVEVRRSDKAFITPSDPYLTCNSKQIQLRTATSMAADFEWAGPNGFTQRDEGAMRSAIDVTVPGTYTLTVTNPVTGCQAFASKVVNAYYPILTADAGEDKLLSCENKTVTLEGSANGSTAVKWLTADGRLTLSNSETIVVNKPGDYVFMAVDEATGCTATDTVTVGGSQAPDFEFYINMHDDYITCKNKEVSIYVKNQPEGVTYAWTGPDGFTSDKAYIDATVVGEYSLTLTNPVNGCQVTKSIPVGERYPEVTVSAGPDQVLSCKNKTVTLIGSVTGAVPFMHWYTEEGQHIQYGNNLVVDQPGKYVMWVPEPESGCSFTDTVEVIMDMEVPDITAQGGMLSSDAGTLQLMGSSTTNGVTYSWTGPEGYTSTEQNPVVAAAGDYTLTVTSTANGCAATATVTVEAQAMTSTESISQVQAYPNPVIDKANIAFRLKATEAYVVNLYDLKGKLVQQLSAGHAKTGELVQIGFDGRGLHNGVYVAHIQSASGAKTVKLILKK